jgi:glycosyltransferase 2 family protein
VLLIPLPEWVSSSGYSFIGISLLVSLGVFAVALRREKVAMLAARLIERLPEHFQASANGRFHAVLASLDGLDKGPDVFRLAFWSVLIFGTAILNNHLTLLALGIYLPVTASLLILVTVQVGITMPSVPGRIGIFEYICVLALAVFGVGQAQAFGYGVLLHAIVLVPSTLLGLLLFFMMGVSADSGGQRSPAILAGKELHRVKPEQRYLEP